MNVKNPRSSQLKYLVLLLVILSACKKEEVDQNLPPVNTHSATAKVTISHLYDIPNSLDSLVPFAQVKVYETIEDLTFDENRLYDRTSDSLGFVEINGISKTKIYLKAFHTSLGNKVDSVSTPDGTISFLEIIYF